MHNYPPALSTPPAINSYGGEVKSIEEVYDKAKGQEESLNERLKALEERDRQLMAANILNGQTAQTADLNYIYI